jgi:hypothetical protein
MSNSLSRKYPDNRWNGVYIGIVKETQDAHRTGRLLVWIPEMSSDPEDRKGWKMVNYCSPFAGATNPEANKSQNTRIFENTQTSYGFWAVPPDVGNQVLCVFANGRAERGFWIGCLFGSFMNQMIPGIAAGENYFVRDKFPDTETEWKSLPTAEYNKYQDIPPDPSNEENTVRPRSTTRHNGIGKQGLINDHVRGLNSSSARRETPSSVVGLLTPGPPSDSNDGHRKGGHSFVMDDASGSEYIGFTTRSGAKIKIDETNGLIYAINRDGTSWIQMDADGNVDIFGAKSFSVRSQEDINLRADRNINIEAGQNIYMKAAKDTDADLNIVGEDEGIGGDIFIQALNDEHHWVKENVYLTITDGNLDIDVQTGTKKEHVKDNVDITYDADLTTKVSGNEDITNESNVTSVINGNSDHKVGGNVVEETVGNVDRKIGGYYHIESSADTTISASNVVLDSGGNLSINSTLETGGGATIGGNLEANDISGATIVGSTKVHSPVEVSTLLKKLSAQPVTSPDSASAGSAGASTSAVSAGIPSSPVDTEIPIPAETKPMVDKTNILVGFDDEDTWFDRQRQEIRTISDRFMSFEPCQDHVNKGEIDSEGE